MVNLKNLKTWSQAGLQANQNLSNFANNAVSNPTDYINQIMNSYQGSDIFNRKVQSNSDFFRNQMTARGLNGSNYSDQKIMEMINNLVGEDMQQYLTNALGVSNSGLQSLNNLANTGMQAESNAQNLQMQQNAFDAQQNDKGSFFGNLFKTGLGAFTQNLFGLGNSAIQDKFNFWYGKKNPYSSFGINNQINSGLANYLNRNPNAFENAFTGQNGGNFLQYFTKK